MSYKLVIFDCDGTLVDTAVDVASCFGDALEQCGFPRCEFDEVAALLGKPLHEIIAGLLPSDVDEQARCRIADTYKRIYASCPKVNTVLFPGMLGLVDELLRNGTIVAVNSNKPAPALNKLIADLLPGRVVLAAGLDDKYDPKPCPEAALELAAMASCKPSEAVYVGDTIIDLETACAAGMKPLIVNWGQGGPLLKEDERVVCYVESVDDIRAFLEGGVY